MADQKAGKKKGKELAWNTYNKQEITALEKLCSGYRDFLSHCKTERESTAEAVREAQAAGYRDLADILAKGETLKAGDKVYAVCMKKAIALFNIGTEPLE